VHVLRFIYFIKLQVLRGKGRKNEQKEKDTKGKAIVEHYTASALEIVSKTFQHESLYLKQSSIFPTKLLVDVIKLD
jgi:hypothetical protein